MPGGEMAAPVVQTTPTQRRNELVDHVVAKVRKAGDTVALGLAKLWQPTGPHGKLAALGCLSYGAINAVPR